MLQTKFVDMMQRWVGATFTLSRQYIDRLVQDCSSSSALALESTQWGRVTDICVGNLTIIVSDNGLSPYRRQAIIWTNAGLLLIGPLGTNVGEILIEILTLSFKKMRLKVSCAKRRPFCLGLNGLIQSCIDVSSFQQTE